MDKVIMAVLKTLADEHGKTPSMYEMHEALRLARQLHDAGMESEEAALQAGTVIFRLYATESPPWQR